MSTRAAATTKRTGPARVALLGCGTVGREVAARLLALPRGSEVELVKVLVRDPSRPRPGLPEGARGLMTTSFEEVMAAAPDVVVELIGGLDPATDLIARSLRAGVPVVTANKTVVAHHGHTLAGLAGVHGAALAFEASVCAGLPVLATLAQMRGDRIRSIRGIVSGSCNYILTRLGAGVAFEAAVREAQERGLVEPDPTADVSGRDCVEKACILAAAAGWPEVTPEMVKAEGITGLTAADLAAARRTGHTVKMLVELEFGERGEEGPSVRVGPALVPLRHPLAAISGEENAVMIDAELAGEVFLRGPGAGPRPTASAVLGDVARVLGEGATCERPRGGGPRPTRRSGAHLISVRGEAGEFGPSRVLEALDGHPIAVREVEVSRTMAHVLGWGTGEAARACGRAIARGDEGRVVIVPGVGGTDRSRKQ